MEEKEKELALGVELIHKQIASNPTLRDIAQKITDHNPEDEKGFGDLFRQLRAGLNPASLPYERIIGMIGRDPMSLALGVSRNTYNKIEDYKGCGMHTVKKLKKQLREILEAEA